MEIQQPSEHEDEKALSSQPTRPEVQREDGPRIYVASLSDYNDGRLHGAWIEADVAPEEIERSIQTMLARSPSAGAEEFAIHDFEGFGPWRPDEYESIGTVAVVARGIAEHGNAFGHWAAILNDIGPDDLATFEDAYLGHWPTVEAYAEELVEGIGLFNEDDLPDSVSGYLHFDYEGFARDLELSGDITTSEGDGGVYVFEGYR